MVTKTEKSYEITRGRTNIALPSGRRVAHPFYGPGSAKDLRDAIRADGLAEPDGTVSAEFLATAYNHDEPEFNEARGIMRKSYFRVFEGHNYDGDSQKLFVVTPALLDFDAQGRIVIPKAKQLEKRIKDGDTKVRALSFNLLYGGAARLSRPKEVDRIRPYLEFVYGEEGAEQLLDVADKTKRKEICIWLPDMPSSGEQELRIGALGVDFIGGGLGVDGDDGGLGEGVRAFGVFPNSATPRAKK